MLDVEPFFIQNQNPFKTYYGGVKHSFKEQIDVDGFGRFSIDHGYFSGLFGYFPPYVNKDNYCKFADFGWSKLIFELKQTQNAFIEEDLLITNGKIWTVGYNDQIMGVNDNFGRRIAFNFTSKSIKKFDYNNIGEATVFFKLNNKKHGLPTGLLLGEEDNNLVARTISPGVLGIFNDQRFIFDVFFQLEKKSQRENIVYGQNFILGRKLQLAQWQLGYLYQLLY